MPVGSGRRGGGGASAGTTLMVGFGPLLGGGFGEAPPPVALQLPIFGRNVYVTTEKSKKV